MMTAILGLYCTCLADAPLVESSLEQGRFQSKSRALTLVKTTPKSFNLPRNPWDEFYSTHGEGFFKDRHYLEAEYCSLSSALNQTKEIVRIFDLGCGVGNSILPLLERSSGRIEYFGVDVSSKAVSILQTKLDQFPPRHLGIARVLDVVNCSIEEWNSKLDEFYSLSSSSRPFDFCLMIFTVSAFPPNRMLEVISRTCKLLVPGRGKVCFRDYSEGDLAQSRFPTGQQLGRNLFIRQDGTLSFFFTNAGLISLFHATKSTNCVWIRKHQRVVENRATDVQMNRSWVGAEFISTLPV
jgi:SAM-dependent methyltransferase